MVGTMLVGRARSCIITALVAAAIGGLGATRADADTPARLTVFAATSLTAAFAEIVEGFAQSRPELATETNFAGSPTLVRQIREGAPADVFAAADEASMENLVQARLAASAPRIFARNRLGIAVERENPRRIATLADLTRPGLVVALAAPGVPAGRYAREAFARAGVALPEASQEVDVKAVVQKVALGEADAGVVYVTDAAGAAIELVAIPDEQNVVARYPIAVLTAAENRVMAESFVEFVLGAAGRRILMRHGFLAP